MPLGPKRPDVDELTDAVHRQMFDLDDPGFCTKCGEWVDSGCEPDARNYPCEVNDCGPYVYGAQELLFHQIS